MKISIVAFAAMLLGTTAASAAPTFYVSSNTNVAGEVTLDFDSPTPAGFVVDGTIAQGSQTNVYREPFAGAGKYLTTLGTPGTSQILNAITGYQTVSFYWGSIDTYNSFELLDAAGNAIGSAVNSAFLGLTADGLSGARVNVISDGPAIHGLRFNSGQPAFEVDNVVFNAAVPEPASWAMMVLGFGLIGAAARGARRRPAMTFMA